MGKWLDATRQKGGLRELVGIGVGKAWLDKVAGKPAVLNVEVQLTNRSLDETLEFSGWRPDNQPQSESQATMIDDAGVVLLAAPVRPAAGRRRRGGGSLRKNPPRSSCASCFPIRSQSISAWRCPTRPWDRRDTWDFELPRQMIKEGDPDAKEKAAPEAAEPKPETLLPARETVKSMPGEPETVRDLRSEIERSGDAKNDAMNEPSKPAADEPLRNPAPAAAP